MARDLEARIRELEQEVRKLKKAQQNVLGTRDNPIRATYLVDGKTGAVARVDYDSANSTVRTTKER